MIRSGLVLAWLVALGTCFDFGKPNYYRTGDKVDLIVNKVESDITQLPFEYYNLPFVCPPANSDNPLALSLGEIMRGDRLWVSSYDLKFGIDMPCMRLCDLISTESGIKKADYLIRNGYVTHWLLDGLPGATTFVSEKGGNKYYAAGFPLGFVEKDLSYIYNHVMLVIRYHKSRRTGDSTIVGFEVYPRSVINEKCPGSSTNYENFALKPNTKELGKDGKPKTIIPYTYSVYWREDNSIDYDHRWDLYYENENSHDNHKIHWFSFINSLVLMFLLTLVVAAVLIRVLKKDISKSTSLPLTSDYSGADETSTRGILNGLIEAVNKSPSFSTPLTVLVSSGIQMFVATFGVILVFVINSNFNLGHSRSSSNLFNNHQGAVQSLSVFSLCISGFISSYSGIILHKLLTNNHVNHEYSRTKVIVFSMVFAGFLPALVLSVILFLNFFVWAKRSSNALPFGTIVVLLSIIVIIELPLGIVGGYYGNKRKFDRRSILYNTTDYSGKKDSEKTLQPLQSKKSLFINPVLNTLVFGMVPFGIVFVELVFLFNSIWLEKTTFYYMYGFLFFNTIMLLIIIAESVIVAVYISLVLYKNPYWHWLSFRTGSSLGWYVFAYSCYYFVFYLNIRDFVSVLFYFTYMALTSVLVAISGGAIGLLTALIFIKKIYGVVKVD